MRGPVPRWAGSGPARNGLSRRLTVIVHPCFGMHHISCCCRPVRLQVTECAARGLHGRYAVGSLEDFGCGENTFDLAPVLCCRAALTLAPALIASDTAVCRSSWGGREVLSLALARFTAPWNRPETELPGRRNPPTSELHRRSS